MTDNEITKALEIFYEEDNDMLLTKSVAKGLLDLINRQSAEIDILIRKKHTLRDEIAELQAEVERLQKANEELGKAIAGAYELNCFLEASRKCVRNEAYKEFAELVNNRLFKGEKFAYERDYIKNLVKELSEVSDNA